jgi:hypothetical protein
VAAGVRGVTRPQAVALVLGLVIIFAVAMVIGVGSEARPNGDSGFSEVRTAAYTVVAGIFVFVVGQILQRFFLEPIQEQRRSFGEVTFAVRYYSGTLLFGAATGSWHYKAGTPEVKKEASERLYKLSAEVRASLSTVPYYQACERLGFVKKRETVEAVALNLQGWALYVKLGDSSAAARHRAAVAKALGLPPA